MIRGRGSIIVRLLKLSRRLEGARYAPNLLELAHEFGVCERTIRRDLECLEEAGIRVPKWRDEYRKSA
jgi:predicted DNA-binding transcriptional regulator YafY